MRRFRFDVAVLALALAVPAVAYAQDRDGYRPWNREARLKQFMERVDTDHDGTISAAEAEQYVGDRFDRLDADHDGGLTLDEYLAPLRRALERAGEPRKAGLEKALQRAEADYKALDKAGTGHVTKETYLADSRAKFAETDKDRTGVLTLEQLRNARGHAF